MKLSTCESIQFMKLPYMAGEMAISRRRRKHLFCSFMMEFNKWSYQSFEYSNFKALEAGKILTRNNLIHIF